MYEQVLDPVGDSLFASALVAMVPLATLFILLGGLKLKAHVAGLAALVVAMAIAILVWGMPFGTTVAVATEGAAFGLFPIIWIIWNAIWIYTMTVETGHLAVLRRSFGAISDDQRIHLPQLSPDPRLAGRGGDRQRHLVELALRRVAGHRGQAGGSGSSLLAAANSSGGVPGKMVSPQNLAIGAAAVGLGGEEGERFRRVVGWSVVLLVIIMWVLVYLQSTAVLSWMVV